MSELDEESAEREINAMQAEIDSIVQRHRAVLPIVHELQATVAHLAWMLGAAADDDAPAPPKKKKAGGAQKQQKPRKPPTGRHRQDTNSAKDKDVGALSISFYKLPRVKEKSPLNGFVRASAAGIGAPMGVAELAKLNIISTGLSPAQKTLCDNFNCNLDAQISLENGFDCDATHLIVGAHYWTRYSDSVYEVLLALQQGVILIDEQWITRCLHQKQILQVTPNSDYEAFCTLSEHVFDGYNFYLSQLDVCQRLPRPYLEQMMGCGGGAMQPDAETMMAAVEAAEMRRDRCFIVFPLRARHSPVRVYQAEKVEERSGLQTLDGGAIVEAHRLKRFAMVKANKYNVDCPSLSSTLFACPFLCFVVE